MCIDFQFYYRNSNSFESVECVIFFVWQTAVSISNNQVLNDYCYCSRKWLTSIKIWFALARLIFACVLRSHAFLELTPIKFAEGRNHNNNNNVSTRVHKLRFYKIHLLNSGVHTSKLLCTLLTFFFFAARNVYLSIFYLSMFLFFSF